MTKAEKAWANLTKGIVERAEFRIGEFVRFKDDPPTLWKITLVMPGVFGGVEYEVREAHGTKRGMASDNNLIKG